MTAPTPGSADKPSSAKTENTLYAGNADVESTARSLVTQLRESRSAQFRTSDVIFQRDVMRRVRELLNG